MTLRFVARRTLHSALLLVAISVLSFLLFDLAPGDFFNEIKLDPGISAGSAEALREQYGLTQAWPVRYWRWVESAGRGEFGVSFAYNMPVGQLMAPRIANTLLLTGLSLLVAWSVALPLGLVSARFDSGVPAGMALLLALPELALAYAAVYFAAKTGWLPAGGMRGADGGGVLAHLVLPVLVLSLATLPVLVGHVRSALLQVAEAPYIRAARAHGIASGRLWTHHILPAAANPLTALAGLSVAGLLSSSLLVEVIFNWPGLGPLLVEAIAARDVFVVLGAVLYSAAFVIAGNLLGDLLLAACDPRIRWGRR